VFLLRRQTVFQVKNEDKKKSASWNIGYIFFQLKEQFGITNLSLKKRFTLLIIISAKSNFATSKLEKESFAAYRFAG
jgi:hypothetical protein